MRAMFSVIILKTGEIVGKTFVVFSNSLSHDLSWPSQKGIKIKLVIFKARLVQSYRMGTVPSSSSTSTGIVCSANTQLQY